MFSRIKQIIRLFLPERLRLYLSDLVHRQEFLCEQERKVQMIIKMFAKEKYPSFTGKVTENSGRIEINRHELKFYSQNGEDGILMYIFSRIGTTDQQFIEFGIGTGRECNTTNLALCFGWHGLMMDCNKYGLSYARHFFRQMLSEKSTNVKVIECLVTPENINKVLQNNEFKKEIDLLSIDIDGNDYWVWKAIEIISPRVVVIEYNASFGPERAMTVLYDEHFDRFRYHPQGWYLGASLAALKKLADSKGYILIGCDSNGVNAFFVRKNIAKDRLPEISVRDAYFPNAGREKIMPTEEQFKSISHLEFAEV